MSVLLIEDSPNRITKFRQGCIGVSLTNLKTSSLAISWLKDHSPKLIFLDYDLHEYGTDRAESGCGGDVVSWMVKHTKQFQHTLVVIHSPNKTGSSRMLVQLQEHDISATLMPFVWERPADLERLMLGIS